MTTAKSCEPAIEIRWVKLGHNRQLEYRSLVCQILSNGLCTPSEWSRWRIVQTIEANDAAYEDVRSSRWNYGGTMTRDEYRTACLEAMKAGFFSEYNQPNPPPGVDICLRAAFDYLHDLVRVMPIEATKEMLNAAYRYQPDPKGPYYIGVWIAMSSIGDLTNPPGVQK